MDPGNGTVADTRTGLTWEKGVSEGVYTHEEALSYCAELSLADGGWRLAAGGCPRCPSC